MLQWHVIPMALLILSTIGCQGVPSTLQSEKPAILNGNNPAIREKLLAQIPPGTPQTEAVRRIHELGFEMPPKFEQGSESHEQILCRYTGRNGLFSNATWLIQLDCPEGKVADIFVEKIVIQ